MITRPNITTRIAGPLLIGILTLTACGSDDVAESTPSAETTAATDEADVPEEAETTEPAAPAASGSNEEFCNALAEYIERPSDPDGADDPAELQPVVAVAPPEIAADMQLMVTMLTEMFEFDGMTASDDEIAEFETLVAEFEPVSEKVEAWTTENCPGLDL